MSKKNTLGSATDIKYVGPEPVFDDQPVSDEKLGQAYNWYNYVCDHSQAKEFTIEYFKANKAGKELLSLLAKLPDHRFMTIGWICRMLLRGAKLSDRTIGWMKDRAKYLIEQAKLVQEEQKAEEKPSNVISIQDRMAEQVSNLIGEFEGEVDNFISTGESNFSPFNFLREKGVKGPQAKAIADHYERLRDELQEVLEGSDEQLKEAYRHMRKPMVKKYLALIELIITDCNQVFSNAKAMRKTRRKKQKSVEQIVSKVKYMKADAALKVTSVDPSEIIRAQQVWVYNVKKRKLGCYFAKAGGGLNIKGTTILDYDEKASSQKKLRKPEQIVPQVTQAGKVALRRIMVDINAKEAPLNGRINADTLILKVVK